MGKKKKKKDKKKRDLEARVEAALAARQALEEEFDEPPPEDDMLGFRTAMAALGFVALIASAASVEIGGRRLADMWDDKGWPTVTGEIISAEADDQAGSTGGSAMSKRHGAESTPARYRVVTTFTYEVDGEIYTGVGYRSASDMAEARVAAAKITVGEAYGPIAVKPGDPLTYELQTGITFNKLLNAVMYLGAAPFGLFFYLTFVVFPDGTEWSNNARLALVALGAALVPLTWWLL